MPLPPWHPIIHTPSLSTRTLNPACIQILFLSPSCPAPAAPAVAGPLTQFKQKGLEHPTAVNVEGAGQNRYTGAAVHQGQSGHACAYAIMAFNALLTCRLRPAVQFCISERGRIKRCQRCEREYSHDSGLPTVSAAPSQITQPALPHHLAQHPERRQQGVGLITFSA